MSKRKADSIQNIEEKVNVFKELLCLKTLPNLARYLECDKEEIDKLYEKVRTYTLLGNQLITSFKNKKEFVNSITSPNYPPVDRQSLLSFSDELEEMMNTMSHFMRHRSQVEEYCRKILKKIYKNKINDNPFEFDEYKISPKAKDFMLLSGIETNTQNFLSYYFRCGIPQFYECGRMYHNMINNEYNIVDVNNIIQKWLKIWRSYLYICQNYIAYSDDYMKNLDDFIQTYFSV